MHPVCNYWYMHAYVLGSGGSTPVMDEPTYHEEESQEVRMCYFLLNILRNRAQMTD